MDWKKTYSFEELETADFGSSPLAVVGHPIKHSISPAMHNAALAKLSEVDTRFKDWTYYRFDIVPEKLSEALLLFHQRKFLGLNLTIPHKVRALELIEGISPEAQSMGAVNTLVRNETGYYGLNTDGYGLGQALELDLGVALKDAAVMVLGSGGAARAAAVQAIISGCSQLYIGNRSIGRLQELIEALKQFSNKVDVQTFKLSELPQDLPESGVVINATALGLQPGDPAPIDVAQLPAGWKVYDMVYNPATTSLLNQAKARGLKVANGLSMLVHQGARALEAWTQNKVDAAIMMAAANDALKKLSLRND